MAGELASVLLPHCLNQEAAFLSRNTKIGSTLRFSPWVLTRHNVARTLSSFLPFLYSVVPRVVWPAFGAVEPYASNSSRRDLL